MKTQGSRAGPGVKGKRRGPRRLKASATPRQEERGPQHLAFSHGNPSGDGLTTADDDGLRHSPADAVTYEVDPGSYFERVSLTIKADPHTPAQQRFILDMAWGRWYQPPDGAGAGVPAPNRPPVLTGEATVEIETPAMAT